MKRLADYIEQISDDFQSTFGLIDETTMRNLLRENEKEELVSIIRKHLSDDVIVDFEKVHSVSDYKDIYIIRVSEP